MLLLTEFNLLYVALRLVRLFPYCQGGYLSKLSFYFGALVSSCFLRGEKGIQMKLNVTEGGGFVIRCLRFFFSPPHHLGISVANTSRVTRVALNQLDVF